jgi:hypothetical protein
VSRLRRILVSLPFLAAAGLLALYALAGFVLAPAYLERAIPRFIQDKLHAKGEVAGIRINPFLFKYEMRGFRLSSGEGEPLLALERLFVDFEASSLVRWAWTFDEIALEQPVLTLRIDPRGELNLASLVRRLLALDDASPKVADPKLPRVLVRRMALTRGGVSLLDQTNPKLERAHVENIALEVRDVSTIPGADGEYSVSAKLPGDGAAAWRGKVSLAPLASQGEVSVKGLRLARVVPFVPLELRIEEPPGLLELGLRYRVSYGGGKFHVAADAMSLQASGVEVRPTGAAAPVLQLAEAKLQGGSFDLSEQRLGFAELVLRGGRISATVDESGVSDWQRLVAPRAATGTPAAEAKAKPGSAPEQWKLALGAARVEDFALRVMDESRMQPLAAEIGRADVAFSASAQTGETLAAAVENLVVDVKKVALGARGAKEPLVTLEQAKLEGGSADLARRAASVAAVKLSGGAARVVREADGSIGLLQLLAPKRPAPAPGAAEGGAAFTLSLAQAELERFAVQVADKGVEPAIQYDIVDLQARVADVSTDGKKPVRYEMAAKVKQGGALRAAGNFDPTRLRADAKVAATRVALAPLGPMVAQYTVLKLASGSASAEGRVTWDGKAKDLAVAYAGSAAIDDLRLDDLAGKRLMGWKALAVSGIQLDTAKAQVAVKDVAVREPAGVVIVDKERNLNLVQALQKPGAKPEAKAADPAPAKPAATAKPAPNPGPAGAALPFAVTVDRVTVEKGDIDFADQGLVLPFAARIQDLGGSIIGLSSDPASRAAAKLEGRVDEYGLARIGGTVSAFAPRQHTNLEVTFRNIALPPMSPYSATFAGRLIASGRVSADLQYRIENSELKGENRIVLEKFALGERVESPNAINLPLDLAIALLTDSEGKIDLAMPVSGNVDKPEFSYGHLVWQAIRTVVTNIVTAPFRALGSLLGGGPPPETVAFDPGSARLLPPEREKLGRVAKSLQQRPQLKVVVQGSHDAERDGRALREAAVRQELARRLELAPTPGGVAPPLPFDNAKLQRTLEAMLTERAGGDGMIKFIADFEEQAARKADRVNAMLAVVGRGSADRQLYEAMFQRLVELQPLPATALQDLARQRSAAVAEALGGAAGLPAERIAQKDPEAAAGDASARLSLDVQKAPS